MDIADVAVSDLSSYDSLIVGAPTWHTGADEGRSGTAWDEAYGDIRSLDLSGKKVAVFGVGDSSAYGEYFCDAIEELHSAFRDTGAEMCGGNVSKDDYDFADSKALVDGVFIGLPFDEDNESHKSEERANNWCKQLSNAGFK